MAFAKNEVSQRLVPQTLGSFRKRSPRSGAHSRLIAAVVLKVNDQPKRPRSAYVQLQQPKSHARVPLGSLVVTEGQTVLLERNSSLRGAKRHFSVVAVVSSTSAGQATSRMDLLAREIHVDVHDLFEDVRAAVAHVPSAPKVYSDLDDEAVHALRAGGLALGEVPPPAERASTWTALETRKLFRESVSPEQVARQTGTTVEELLRAVADRHLLSMTLDGELRLPGYQFREDGAPVAGLDSVTAALPEGLHPVAAMRFLTMPNPDLEVAGQPVSPVEWLRRGLDPLPVVDLANDIALGQ